MSASPPIFRAAEVPHWDAKVLERRPMTYREGPSDQADRPAHVRAASGLSAFRDYIAVIQDDANWLALVSPDGTVSAVPLPPSPHGDRVFSKRRGNHGDKYDLEACVTVHSKDGLELVGFASGSRDDRCSILRVREAAGKEAGGVPQLVAEFVEAPAFYQSLRENRLFSGAGLNIEGALALGPERIRLFQRGNAEAKDGVEPVDATADLDWTALCRHLTEPERVPPPPLENIRCYDLGQLDGVRLTFSDAELLDDGRILFSASAEAKVHGNEQDGAIRGSVLGIIERGGAARWTRLADQDGRPFTGKIEGLTRLDDETDQIHFVVDDDDEDEPSAIFVARLAPNFLEEADAG